MFASLSILIISQMWGSNEKSDQHPLGETQDGAITRSRSATTDPFRRSNRTERDPPQPPQPALSPQPPQPVPSPQAPQPAPSQQPYDLPQPLAARSRQEEHPVPREDQGATAASKKIFNHHFLSPQSEPVPDTMEPVTAETIVSYTDSGNNRILSTDPPPIVHNPKSSGAIPKLHQFEPPQVQVPVRELDEIDAQLDRARRQLELMQLQEEIAARSFNQSTPALTTQQAPRQILQVDPQPILPEAAAQRALRCSSQTRKEHYRHLQGTKTASTSWSFSKSSRR